MQFDGTTRTSGHEVDDFITRFVNSSEVHLGKYKIPDYNNVPNKEKITFRT